MHAALLALVASSLLALTAAQCDVQRDFPETFEMTGRNVYCSPTPPGAPCNDIEYTYKCNNMMVDSEDKSQKVRVDLFGYVPDGQDTNIAKLCNDMVQAINVNITVDYTGVNLKKLVKSAYFNNDGWKSRDNPGIDNLTCVLAYQIPPKQ